MSLLQPVRREVGRHPEQVGAKVIDCRGLIQPKQLEPLESPAPGKRIGLLPGLVIEPDFFEPLPDDEIKAWEGIR